MLAGRLAQFITNWEKVMQYRWVLQAIRPMSAINCSIEQREMTSKEIRELLAKGAVVETTRSQEGFVSQVFLVAKKEGGQRPVINLKALNVFVKHKISKWRDYISFPTSSNHRIG